jgi:hypothetical protein
MKISTHALSLERVYGRDGTPMFSVDAIAVDFSTVQINSHEIMLGDHPSVSSGPPFTIEWTALHSCELTVDEYEERNPYPRSSLEALLLPKAVREDRLRKQGYSAQQLEIATQAVNKVKENRQASAGDGGSSCMNISTHALSLERAYGKDGTPKFSMDARDAITVAFSTVQIHSHEIMLGDHPSVSSGPAVTIEWTALHTRKLTIDEYEERNPSPSRSSHKALLLPRAVREDRLRKHGYSTRQLEIATRAVNKIKKNRRSSVGDGRGWSWSRKVIQRGKCS